MQQLFFKEKYARFDRETPFEFSMRSSIGCGGKAGIAFYPKSVKELAELVKNLDEDKIPFYMLGNLTNVLPSEGKINRVIVCTRKMCGEENGFFPAGISSAKLLSICEQASLSGAEFLEGIPCTLGGALFMNAGVGGRYIAEIVESVAMYQEGEVHSLSVAECGYSYKKSVFMDKNSVILGAKLALVDADKDWIISERQRYRRRRAHLPKGKSMGCVFKNPDGYVAGRLIEGAGLKGLRIGGAKISNLHGNFIINDGKATASDVRTLIEIIKKAVFAQYKIRLEEEIRYIT